MNNLLLSNSIRFILLCAVQILIFNSLNFLGFINPMVYILFLFWYPIRKNRAVFLLVSFLLGIVMDLFADTLALHATATITVAFIRPVVMRFCFGVNYEFQNFSLKNTTIVQRLTFLAILVMTHQLIFFSLEILSLSHLLLILKKLLATGIVTILLCALFSSLFSSKTE